MNLDSYLDVNFTLIRDESELLQEFCLKKVLQNLNCHRPPVDPYLLSLRRQSRVSR